MGGTIWLQTIRPAHPYLMPTRPIPKVSFKHYRVPAIDSVDFKWPFAAPFEPRFLLLVRAQPDSVHRSHPQ